MARIRPYSTAAGNSRNPKSAKRRMDEEDKNMNKKTATWVTAAVLASVAAPILAKTQQDQPVHATATTASVQGPVAGYAISEEYARLVARQTYFWAWPMVNVYGRL